jgi:hypothetical protein
MKLVGQATHLRDRRFGDLRWFIARVAQALAADLRSRLDRLRDRANAPGARVRMTAQRG